MKSALHNSRFSPTGMVLIGGAIAGIVVGSLITSSPDRVLRSTIPAVELTGESVFSAEHDATIAWLHNSIGRRAKWSASDREKVIGMLAEPWHDWPRPHSSDEREVWDEYSTLIAIISDRWRAGVGPDGEIEAVYRDAVVALLSHPQPYARQRGVSAAGNSWLAEDADILARVSALRSDPDPEVRRMVEIKLGQIAGVPAHIGAGCPTCPPTGAIP